MLRNLFARTDAPTISVRDLKSMLDAHAPMVLVDVRQSDEFAHDGHVAGARLLPLPMLATRLDELGRDEAIVCICRSGSRSQVACELLLRQGFSNVTNVSGGMIAWQQAGLPSKRG